MLNLCNITLRRDIETIYGDEVILCRLEGNNSAVKGTWNSHNLFPLFLQKA